MRTIPMIPAKWTKRSAALAIAATAAMGAAACEPEAAAPPPEPGAVGRLDYSVPTTRNGGELASDVAVGAVGESFVASQALGRPVGNHGIVTRVSPGGVGEWREVLPIDTNSTVNAIAYDPAADQVVVAGTSEVPDNPATGRDERFQRTFFARMSARTGAVNSMWSGDIHRGGTGSSFVTDVAIGPDGTVYAAGGIFERGLVRGRLWAYDHLGGRVGAVDPFGAEPAPNTTVTGVTVHRSGAVYATGVVSDGRSDRALVARYDGALAQVWREILGGAGSERASGVAIHGRRLYVVGATTSDWATGGVVGHEQMLTLRLDARDGRLVWASQRGRPDAAERAADVVTDDAGRPYVVGSRGNFELDTLVVALGTDGTERWARRPAIEAPDYGAAIGMAPDGSLRVLASRNGTPTIIVYR